MIQRRKSMNKQQFAHLCLQGLVLQADKLTHSLVSEGGVLFFFVFFCLAQSGNIYDRWAKIT